MSKIPVVLLPALLCNAGLYIAQIRSLSEQAGFFVPDLGLDDNIQDTAARILSAFTGQFVLGGISMGGYVAFEILRQAPERVAGLILMDTNAKADPPAVRESRSERMKKAETEGIESVIEDCLYSVLSPLHREDPTLCGLLAHMAQQTDVKGFVNEQKIIMNRPSSEDLLEKISCPTMVLAGSQDQISPPADMKKMAEKIPHSFFAEIANSGHFPPLENPKAATAAFSMFLKRFGATPNA